METFTDDTVVALASFLSPHDMLSLSLTCKRFGEKHGMDKKQSADRRESTREVKQKTETLSLMEVAARTVLHTKWTDEERNALPRRGDESWIGIYNDFLLMFRLPLQFDKLVGESVEYVDISDKTKVNSISGDQLMSSTAICSNIMRAGKHCVSFDFTNDGDQRSYGILCGIMRPLTKDITTLTRTCNPLISDLSSFSLKDYEMLHSNDNVDCCLMSTSVGAGMIRRRWKEWEESELAAMNQEQRERRSNCHAVGWEGMEETEEVSFKIGMVLDLDEGTLDVYKNDRRLGTMMSGLVGEYCWAIIKISDGQSQVSASIGR